MRSDRFPDRSPFITATRGCFYVRILVQGQEGGPDAEIYPPLAGWAKKQFRYIP